MLHLDCKTRRTRWNGVGTVGNFSFDDWESLSCCCCVYKCFKVANFALSFLIFCAFNPSGKTLRQSKSTLLVWKRS